MTDQENVSGEVSNPGGASDSSNNDGTRLQGEQLVLVICIVWSKNVNVPMRTNYK